MAGSSPTTSPPASLADDYAAVAALHGGKPHHPRRAVPDVRWTFDVSVRRGGVAVTLGRWTFGVHRGPEEATGRDMQTLGHGGEYRYVPVGWPRAGYFGECTGETHDQGEAADDPGVRAGDRPDDGQMDRELPLRRRPPRRVGAGVG
jgi:hypothetical protein